MPTLEETPEEPTDLTVRVTTEKVEWARRLRDGRWAPLGTGGSYTWWSLRHLFPSGTVHLPPPSSTGRTIPARTSDPHTSKAATASIKVRAGSQRARLLAAFGGNHAMPNTYDVQEGLTDEQAARLADDVSMSSEYAKRCSELREAGLIAPTGETRTGVSGAQRIVSRITTAGATVLTTLNA